MCDVINMNDRRIPERKDDYTKEYEERKAAFLKEYGTEEQEGESSWVTDQRKLYNMDIEEAANALNAKITGKVPENPFEKRHQENTLDDMVNLLMKKRGLI